MNISKLKTINDIEDILSQASNYSTDSFKEVDGNLVVMVNGDPKNAFVVGAIKRTGWDAEVTHDGRVVARNERNTGWGFSI